MIDFLEIDIDIKFNKNIQNKPRIFSKFQFLGILSNIVILRTVVQLKYDERVDT